MLSRRDLGLLAVGGAAAGFNRKIPVALQLFSVRKQCQDDLPGTLTRIAQFGFAGVELAGAYGHEPEDLRSLLANRGLVCAGAHVSMDALMGNAFARTVAFHEALGNRTLVVPGLPESMTRGTAGWLETARVFTTLSGRLGEKQMRLGYHNHAVEFRSLDGQRPWDLLFGNTPPEVFIELDLGNAGYGGADPIAALKRYPGRVRMVHVKDYTASKPDLMIGDGQMDWPDFFPVCERTAGTEWFVIEHDSDPAAQLADIRECLQRFRTAGTGG